MTAIARASRAAVPSAGSRASLARRLARNRAGLLGLAIVLTLAVVAVLAPLLAPQDPAKQNLRDKRMRPGARYWLGADEFGRDILSRLIFGTRVALLVGILAVLLALGLGLVFGMAAGYVGGVAEEVIMRATDIFLAFPYLLLAIAIATALGPGVVNTTIAVGIWGAPNFVRIVRASVVAVRDREFVQAARAGGASDLRIIGRHVLPNVVAPVVVYATLFMAQAILVEAALSFLGLGVQPPTPSWGLMVASGRDFLRLAPHIATFPGLAIMLAVLGFNLMGDGLRDVLDPRLRNP